VLTLTPPNDQNEAPTVASLLHNSFDSYKSMIDRYAELLKETNSLSTLIKDKMINLATQEQMNNKIESVNDLVGKKMETFNEVAKEKVNTANKESETSKSSLEAAIVKLTTKLYILMGILAGIFVIGGIGITLVKIVLDARITKQTETIIDTRGQINQPNVVPYWVDNEGKKHYILMEKHPDNPNHEHLGTQPLGTIPVEK